MTWRDKYMRNPELADSIIKALVDDIKEAEKRAEMLTVALEQIRDGDWKYTFATPSRDYWMQQIAREALEL